MTLKIFWPGDVTPEFAQLLRKLHRMPWAEIVDYSSQEIEPDDVQGIRDFLQTHKDPDQFVYVLPATHVAVALADKMRAGWADVNEEARIIAICHHLPDKHRSQVESFNIVWQAKPRIPFAEVSLYRM